MSDPLPFDSFEVRKCIDAGKIVLLGKHVKLARMGDDIVCECSRCQVRMSCSTGVESLGTLPDDFAHFVIRHQHTEAAS